MPGVDHALVEHAIDEHRWGLYAIGYRLADELTTFQPCWFPAGLRRPLLQRAVGIELARLEGESDGPLAVGRCSATLVPFVAHQAGSAEQAVHLPAIAAGPEPQEIAECQISAGVVASVGRGIPLHQAAKHFSVRCARRPI